MTTSLILFHRSGWSSHWYALTATWVPRGFVRTKTSPTTALSGLKNLQIQFSDLLKAFTRNSNNLKYLRIPAIYFLVHHNYAKFVQIYNHTDVPQTIWHVYSKLRGLYVLSGERNDYWLAWYWLCFQKTTHMMNSFGWQTVVPTPPMVNQGFNTVCPPVTDVPASSAKSWMAKSEHFIFFLEFCIRYISCHFFLPNSPQVFSCKGNLNSDWEFRSY